MTLILAIKDWDKTWIAGDWRVLDWEGRIYSDEAEKVQRWGKGKTQYLMWHSWLRTLMDMQMYDIALPNDLSPKELRRFHRESRELAKKHDQIEPKDKETWYMQTRRLFVDKDSIKELDPYGCIIPAFKGYTATWIWNKYALWLLQARKDDEMLFADIEHFIQYVFEVVSKLESSVWPITSLYSIDERWKIESYCV